MKQYDVTGMSCAACSARIEKAVSAVDGVNSCTVSLLTNSMSVDGDANDSAIIDAVQKAGYGAKPKGSVKSAEAEEDSLKDTESPKILKRLIASIVFLIALMYLSMGHMMWGWPIPSALENNHIAVGLIQMLLTIAVMVINQKFFISGFKGLIHGAPNMDTLVALGSGAAFVYSTYSLFAMTFAQVNGDMQGVMSHMHEFYFESAATILTLITVGKLLEAHSKGKTTDALKSLIKLAPKTAVILKDGKETVVPVSNVAVGDIFIVKAGENVPVDGVVIEGDGAVNEAALTGESIPVDKSTGDRVSAATTNSSGYLKCKATRVGEDTTLSQIIKMVSDAAATKAPIAKVADKVSGIFVPIVITIAVITAIVWLLVGQSFGFALARAISVLVISCPCALGLATPVAIMVGSGVGAKNGILFKNAVALESSGRITTVALDKTGTVTKGTPQVTDLFPVSQSRQELIKTAVSLESKSEHPLAKAIVEMAENENIKPDNTESFKVLAGNGLQAVCNGKNIYGGNKNFISRYVDIPSQALELSSELASQGKTPLYFASDGKLDGIIAVADVIKPESPQAVADLHKMGLKVVMLTGDNEKTAKAIAEKVGIDQVVAGVLPDGKAKVIEELKSDGKVAMVGDGINDAPALTCADLGIAIGAGADVAVDAADVVLVKNRLSDVPSAIKLGKSTLRNIHENLFWAFIYNIIGIPLAAGVFINLFGWQLNPMYGAAAMSLSSFFVVTNALRLNFVKLYNSNIENKNSHNKTKEKRIMEKTIKIEGMMCPHCEATVKSALEAVNGVESAQVSHKSGKAVVKLSEDVSSEILKSAIEEKGYKVID